MAFRHFRHLLLLLFTVEIYITSSAAWTHSSISLRYTQDDLENRLEKHLERRFYAVRVGKGGRPRPPQPAMTGFGSRKWVYDWLGVRRTDERNNPCSGGNAALVQYCYANEASRDTLRGLVEPALRIWRPVFQSEENVLTVSPYRKYGEEYEICIGSTPPWVLRIRDCTTQDCLFDASLGMREQDNYIDVNTKTFARLYAEGDPRQTAAVVVEFARKWGNVFGLLAEHLRPDAASYVDFRCLFLQPTDDIMAFVEEIRTDNKDPTRYLSSTYPVVEGDADQLWLAQRIRFVCSGQDPVITAMYFPKALEYLPLPPSRYMIFSEHDFDFDSIMIAPSYLGSMNRGIPPALSRREVNGRPWQSETNDPAYWTLSGGSEDPAHARLSPLDIQRVHQMYPLPPKRGRQPTASSGPSDHRD